MELNLFAELLPVVLPIVRELISLLWWLLPDTVQDLLLWQFVYLPMFLAAGYVLAIQYERGGWWRLLLPFTLVVAIVDVWLNFTTFALYLASAPGRKEVTFSQHLERLVHDPGWRGLIARPIARYTNLFDPTPPHIALPESA